ncbi:MAG TPA: TonB-dependent receptor [Polyangiaceae bacterium]|nr:TonB-dependent receptor [Polyangiaceae bacterium]
MRRLGSLLGLLMGVITTAQAKGEPGESRSVRSSIAATADIDHAPPEGPSAVNAGSESPVQSASRDAVAPPPLQRSAIVPPRLTHFENAIYPKAAQHAEIEADVGLTLTIDRDGRVTRVEVSEPAGHGFDEAAAAAAERFVFEPATRAGVAVAAKIRYRYSFRLEAKLVSPGAESSIAAVQTGELRGKILAGTPPSPIAGVLVRVRADAMLGNAVIREVVSDGKGEWSIPELTPGTYSVELVAIGYRPVTEREQVAVNRATAVTYGLESSDESKIEVTVRGAAMHREVAHYELSRTELVKVPGTMGDAIHAVEAMPSVARPPAFSGTLIVRGSAPQDTQVFVEGTYIPRVFHYASLSSVIPSEMIERLEFYPSNFSSRYGRGMGGIIEVGMRETNPDGRYHGSAQIDFINARANVEGPVPKASGWHFMGGFRSSYVDRWLVPVLRSSGSGLDWMPRYHDYQFYLERRLPNNGVYRVGVFGASDRFVKIDERETGLAPSDSFLHIQSQLRLHLSSRVHLRASWSLGRNRAFEPGDDDRSVRTTYTLGTFRSELAIATSSFGLVRFGTDLLYAPFRVEALADQADSGGALNSAETGAPKLTAYDIRSVYFRPAAYAEYELAPNRRVNVTLGTRVDYTKDTSKWDVAPRLSARTVLIEAPRRTVLKGGIGLFYQPPDPGQTIDELGTKGLTSSRALHSMIGVEQSLSKRVTLSVEAFDKEMRDLIGMRTDGTGNTVAENSGRGRVIGADFLLRYQADERFFGWASYTLSRSTRQLAPGEPTLLYRFDQPHVLNLVGSLRLGRGWEVGGRFQYASGSNYRACPGGLFDNSSGYYRCYGTQAMKRMGPYHQLNLRVEKVWSFDTSRLGLYLDLINAYFHNSPDYPVTNFDRSGVKFQSFSLPLLPSFGLRGEL